LSLKTRSGKHAGTIQGVIMSKNQTSGAATSVGPVKQAWQAPVLETIVIRSETRNWTDPGNDGQGGGGNLGGTAPLS
jgi:hypothetical protein